MPLQIIVDTWLTAECNSLPSDHAACGDRFRLAVSRAAADTPTSGAAPQMELLDRPSPTPRGQVSEPDLEPLTIIALRPSANDLTGPSQVDPILADIASRVPQWKRRIEQRRANSIRPFDSGW